MDKWEIQIHPEVWNRIWKTTNHEMTERVPFWEHLAHEGVFQYFRQGAEPPLKTMARAYRELGIDICRGYGLPTPKNACDTQELRNLSVEQLKKVRDDRQTMSTSSTAFYKDLIRQYRSIQDAFAPRTLYVPTVGTGLTDLYVSVGYERFCLLLKDDPSLVQEVLAQRLKDNVGWVKYAAQHSLCPLFLVAEDIGGNDGLLFSPSWLRRNFLPALSEILQPLKAKGIKVIFHSDGNIMELLPELVDIGIDGLHPIEPRAGMKIADITKQYGEQLLLVGNVDTTGVLRRGDPESIRDAVKRCLQATGKTGHFIGSSGEIGSDIPLDNVFAFCRACRFQKF